MTTNGGLNTSVVFADGTSGGADFQGAVQYLHNGDHLRFLTAQNERARINSNGLSFNGDTAAANALSDYEEGTFTPTYGWSSSAQSGFTASHNYGHYIRIGHIVHIAFWTNFTATPSSSNTLQLQLPFTSKNHSGYRGGIPFSFSGITYVGHDQYSQGGRSHINSNTQWMEMGFISHVDGGTWSSSAITPNAMANASNFQGEGTYICA